MKSYETLKELRSMTPEELESRIAELKEELFNLRFQNAINQLENPHRISDVKRDIARTMTVLHNKRINA